MEGACGKILDTDNANVVIKKIHRRNRAQQRRCSNNAEAQARIQLWAHDLCKSSGFQLLFVPRAWEAERFQYKMDRIDVSKPIESHDMKDHPALAELKMFYALAKKDNIFPADYELYIQPDGRVAMIDFDKFGCWLEDGGIQFPWGMILSSQQVQQLLTLSLP